MNNNKYNKSSKQYKSGILMVSMLGDSSISPDNKFYISNADKTFSRIKKGLDDKKIRENTIIFVGPEDSHSKWEQCQHWKDYKVGKIVTSSDEWIGVDSTIVFKDVTDKSQYRLSAKQFDFIFSPDKYYIAHCGVDWFSGMQKAISKLSGLGYSQSVYLDAAHLYGHNPIVKLKAMGVRPMSTTFERKEKENNEQHSG